MPVKLSQEVGYVPPPLKSGCVYKIIAGYQEGWAFVKTNGNYIQYLSATAGIDTGWDSATVLQKPGTRYVEITLQEV